MSIKQLNQIFVKMEDVLKENSEETFERFLITFLESLKKKKCRKLRGLKPGTDLPQANQAYVKPALNQEYTSA